jgi:SPP1 family predicted phage head-tail adaptor
MNSEPMDRRITVQQKTTTVSDSGEVIEAWGDVLTDEPAQFKPLRGVERFSIQHLIGTSVGTFVLRYHDGITVQSRVLFDGKTWDVTDVREVGRRETTELDAKAAAA